MAEKTHDSLPKAAVEPVKTEIASKREPLHAEEHGPERHPWSYVRLLRSAGATGDDRSDNDSLPLLSRSDFHDIRHAARRNEILGRLQRDYGNRSVQRLLLPPEKDRDDSENQEGKVRLKDGNSAETSSGENVERYIEHSRGQGRPLDEQTRTRMESGFGRDFSGVRLHTDTEAGRAARALGAEAFSTGHDIYFGHSRYQPRTEEGQRLLAHELAHTVQQGGIPPVLKPKLSIGLPDDPLEKEANDVSERVVKSTAKDAVPVINENERSIQRREKSSESAAGNAPPSPEATAEEGGLEIKLGEGIRITADELAKGELDLSGKPVKVPGLSLKEFSYNARRKQGEITADLNVPFAEQARGGIKLKVQENGETTISGTDKLPVKAGALNHPTLDLTVQNRQLAGALNLNADNFKPRGLRSLSVEGGGSIELADGKLAGSANATLTYKNLAKGDFKFNYKDGVPEGGGRLEVTQEFLKGAAAELKVEDGDLKASATIPAGKLSPPVAGLDIPEGTLQLAMLNSDFSGAINGLRLRYKGLGEATLAGEIKNGVASGSGTISLTIPAIESAEGTIAYTNSKLHGGFVLKKNNFPATLPITGGSIRAAIDEKGEASFSGKLYVSFAGVGTGQLHGAYEKGVLSLGADVNLRVPGLQAIAGKIDYVNGDLQGEIDVPIESKKLAGISGNLHVEYREKKWKGEQKIGYERDRGKVKGTVTLGLMQKDDGGLAVYGGGDVTAQLTGFLAGQLKVDISPEGTTKLHGAIVVTEPIQLFPEKKAERELFRISRNIPLWAILVAVIRLRAGVRAGVGPGQLRDITVEGEYTIGEESRPSFVINGELFIPAYAEAYVAFGAGLGLDVVLGSLTGGIEAIGTAGIYGAVSVRPEIAYRDGNYSISGVATMAAGAKIKLGLQAWAEIEALWITVWENTWQLAEWVWDVGPTLALQANMEYAFGRPEPPKFEFKTSDIDAQQLIRDAMPKEGPKGSGAREALKNKAEWSGRSKGKGKAADTVPEEAKGKEKKGLAPKAPPKPAKKARPKGEEAARKRPVKETGGKRTPELEKTIEKAAKEKAKEGAKGEKTPDRTPQFPAPTAAEIEINWANYKKDKVGSRTIERGAFESRMRAGEVYHPKRNRWRSIVDDYQRAFDSMKEADRNPVNFAHKMRDGYIVGSPPEPDPEWDGNLTVPVPDADGTEAKPFSIHWPRQFLVSKFQSFTVHGGQRISPGGNKDYTFTIGGREKTYSFGVSSTFNNEMGLGRKRLRQKPGRTPSRTAKAWEDWDKVGFAGQTGAGASVPDRPNHSDSVTTGDANMFRRHKNPYTGSDLEELTFNQYLEEKRPRAFSHYTQASPAEKEELRTAARGKEIDLRNESGHVREFLTWLRAKREAEAGQRGHAGHEMQHVVPLFLYGAAGDVRENMWPLTVSQHREGHRILANQPQLKSQYNLPTHDLESTQLEGYWFQIVKHGSST